MPPFPKGPQFASLLEASSNQSPGGGSKYAPLRDSVVATAIAQGYDADTMVEYDISWSDDHDPFKHVKNHAYNRFNTMCNMRVVFSFEKHLKRDRFDDFMNARKIGVVVKTGTVDIIRPVKFPDSLIIANHITEVLPDRYYGITTLWSLVQQAVVAEFCGYMVFFDYDAGKPANLIEAGGVYKDLYDALVARKDKEQKIALKWEEEHPKKKSRKAKL